MTTLVAARTAPKVTGVPTSGLFLLVGDTKSGKTTLAASFPGSYVIEFEHKRGDRIAFGRIDDMVERYNEFIANIPESERPDRNAWLLDTFGEVLMQAIEDPAVQTIVIDSVDELQRLINVDVASSAGLEYIGELKDGKEKEGGTGLWQEYFQRIAGMADMLKECGKLVVIVCHRREAKLDKNERIVKPAGINVSGQGGNYLAKHAEIIGFMDVRKMGDKSVFYLTFKGESERAIWRSGVEELQDKEIVISKADPYASFAAAFVKKAVAPAPKLVPAKPQPARAGSRRR
ncbi:MAG: AAA family ATPase [Elusimicrobia bacterium]|nr:AAA family ATPase [Elusimicrobiota bacterium]